MSNFKEFGNRFIRKIINYDDDYGGGGGAGSDTRNASLLPLPRIYKVLKERFEIGGLDAENPHLLGLIFGRDTEPLVKSQIIPNLDYWNERSGNHMDFFCIGFSKDKSFNVSHFTKTVEAFKANTQWDYSGGTDLILLRMKYDATKKEVFLDFSDVLSLTLESVVKVEGYDRLSIFFEKFIAKDITSGSEASDEIGKALAKKGLKEFLLSFLPNSLKKPSRDAFLFVVKNIEKKLF